ncbi:MAG: LLM class flavin-dependent oxidoreductase, partial [Chloroflexota bacterium]|nr:LLM class flavin-dependent oxidoreductase [Chloroflexota bacterium]
LRLGVGLGWNAVEYEALGENFRDRGQRFEEQIQLLRRLWTDESVDFTGRWHRVDRAGLNPLPVQRPIPLWIGADVDVAIRRAARLGDGWFSHLTPDERGRAGMERFRAWAIEAGRDPAAIGVEGRVHAHGGRERWAVDARAFREMGMTHLEFNTMGAGYRTVDEHIEALRDFRELVEV